jgi:hypothetical protein
MGHKSSEDNMSRVMSDAGGDSVYMAKMPDNDFDTDTEIENTEMNKEN